MFGGSRPQSVGSGGTMRGTVQHDSADSAGGRQTAAKLHTHQTQSSEMISCLPGGQLCIELELLPGETSCDGSRI